MKRFVLLIICLTVLLVACGSQNARVSTLILDPFDQMLQATEGVTCARITSHADGAAPDCRKIHDAFVRGRSRVAARDPRATSIPMSRLSFFRPQLYWVDGYPWPLIADEVVDGQQQSYVRGITTVPPYVIQITYSYEEVIEHETVHALTWLLEGDKPRTREAIDADGLAGYNVKPDKLWLIVCHGTSDDPYGEPGKNDGCALPYDGGVR